MGRAGFPCDVNDVAIAYGKLSNVSAHSSAGDVGEHAAAKYLASNGELAPLVVGEPKSAARKLLAQDSVLRFQIVDHVELPAVDPPGEEQEQELERLARHVQPS
jgi:hypothetical protein